MSFHLEQLKELTELINNEIAETEKIITAGVAVKDFPSYKEQVGRLYAYKRSLGLIEDAAKIVEKRE